jgi:hypothetical protein
MGCGLAVIVGGFVDNIQTRSLSLDVFVPVADRERLLPLVRDSLKRYRAAARHMFAIAFAAQAAGGKIEEHAKGLRLTPDSEAAKNILAEIFSKRGKAPLYELREYVLHELGPQLPEGGPAWLSFVWDSLRATCWDFWKAKDPELGAQRGWLALQGARRLAQCAYIGIQFPQATARPKLDSNSVTLKWDHSIGPVTFVMPKMDGSRWHVWRKVRDGEWQPGTVTLTERDGYLYIRIPYALPITDEKPDPARVLEVAPDENNRWRLGIREGQATQVDEVRNAALPLAAVLEGLDALAAQQDRWRDAVSACGNKRGGNRRAFKALQLHRDRCTQRRTAVVDNWNHFWSRQIIAVARQWHCGAVVFFEPETLSQRTWQFADFKAKLNYKAAQFGVAVTSKPEVTTWRKPQAQAVQN